MQRPVIDLLTEGHADPQSWFRRYELYMELYVYKPESKPEGFSDDVLESLKAKHLPFYLGGKVQATYEQLPVEMQEDFGAVKSKILTAYRMSGATAYSKFVSAKYSGGSVDMFVAELGRLLAMVPGMRSLGAVEKDGLILEQLLRGMPEGLARELRLICVDPSTGEVPLERVLERARLLPEGEVSDIGWYRQPAPMVVGAVPRRSNGNVVCYKCGKEGHVRTACPQTEDLCFKCGKPGHRRKDCPNGQGVSVGQKTPLNEVCPSSPSA